MQHAAVRRRRNKTQMPGAQTLVPFGGERLRPGDALSLPLSTSRRTSASSPSETAARVSGGALPMAQRFFALSGITPLTLAVPVGSGGR